MAAVVRRDSGVCSCCWQNRRREVLDGGRGQARQRCVFVLLAEPQEGVHIAARLTMLQAVGQRLGDDGVATQG